MDKPYAMMTMGSVALFSRNAEMSRLQSALGLILDDSGATDEASVIDTICQMKSYPPLPYPRIKRALLFQFLSFSIFTTSRELIIQRGTTSTISIVIRFWCCRLVVGWYN